MSNLILESNTTTSIEQLQSKTKPIKMTASEMDKEPEKWEFYELYNGEPFEMPYSKPEHAKIVAKLSYLINHWIINQGGYGITYSGEGGVRLSELNRYSYDVAWNYELVGEGKIPEKSMSLMVEVISESNDVEKMLQKIQNYILHGAVEVWIILVHAQQMQVYYSDFSAKLYSKDATYVPGDWMKGFSLKVADLFI
ncbi:MAG: Uma2 family endonuclease [Leptospiraceae bacterium]|nr:Uma2 family endonuclease [Leptospiraceae bacterium]